jgi:hypothetical protein
MVWCRIFHIREAWEKGYWKFHWKSLLDESVYILDLTVNGIQHTFCKWITCTLSELWTPFYFMQLLPNLWQGSLLVSVNGNPMTFLCRHRGSVEMYLQPICNSGTRRGGWSAPCPICFTPRKTQYALYRRLGRSCGWFGHAWKILSPPGIRSPDSPACNELLCCMGCLLFW